MADIQNDHFTEMTDVRKDRSIRMTVISAAIILIQIIGHFDKKRTVICLKYNDHFEMTVDLEII